MSSSSSPSSYVPKYLRKRPAFLRKNAADENDPSRSNRQYNTITANDDDDNDDRERRSQNTARDYDPLEIDVYLVNNNNGGGQYRNRLGRNNDNDDDERRDDTMTTTMTTWKKNHHHYHQHHNHHCTDFQFGDTTYRQDGFTIGRDYLRLEGKTITRGQLLPSCLTVQELLGQGAFSRVYKAVWKKENTDITAGGQQQTITTTIRCSPSSSYNEEENKEPDDSCNAVFKIPVAIKQSSILDDSPKQTEMVLKELRTLCEIQCEALVGFHGAFLQGDCIVTVMEYMNGGSLEQLLKEQPPQRSTRTTQEEHHLERFQCAVAYQVFAGLQYLHQRRILHRDIKPGNILLSTDGSVKLCDFGIASLQGDQSLQTTVVGTSRFMSPERLRARPYGRASDIWSVGLVLLEIWTGEMPWHDCDSIVSLVVTVEETETVDLIPSSMDNKSIQDVVLGCLQMAPEKRMPAIVLLQAPWFRKDHDITSINDARLLMQSYQEHVST